MSTPGVVPPGLFEVDPLQLHAVLPISSVGFPFSPSGVREILADRVCPPLPDVIIILVSRIQPKSPVGDIRAPFEDATVEVGHQEFDLIFGWGGQQSHADLLAMRLCILEVLLLAKQHHPFTAHGKLVSFTLLDEGLAQLSLASDRTEAENEENGS